MFSDSWADWICYVLIIFRIIILIPCDSTGLSQVK